MTKLSWNHLNMSLSAKVQDWKQACITVSVGVFSPLAIFSWNVSPLSSAPSWRYYFTPQGPTAATAAAAAATTPPKAYCVLLESNLKRRLPSLSPEL